MSEDWASGEEWDRFVHNVRTELIHKIDSSAIALSIQSGNVDVKLAVETGYMVLLDKPIISILLPGATISKKMRAISDVVIEADIDTEEGERELKRALDEMLERLKEEESP